MYFISHANTPDGGQPVCDSDDALARFLAWSMVLMFSGYLLVMLVRTYVFPDYGDFKTPGTTTPALLAAFSLFMVVALYLSFRGIAWLRWMLLIYSVLSALLQIHLQYQLSWVPVWVLSLHGIYLGGMVFSLELGSRRPGTDGTSAWHLLPSQRWALLFVLLYFGVGYAATLATPNPIQPESNLVLRSTVCGIWSTLGTWALWRSWRAGLPWPEVRTRLLLILAAVLLIFMLTAWLFSDELNASSSHSLSTVVLWRILLALAVFAAFWAWKRTRPFVAQAAWAMALLVIALNQKQLGFIHAGILPLALSIIALWLPPSRQRIPWFAMTLGLSYASLLGELSSAPSALYALNAMVGMVLLVVWHWIRGCHLGSPVHDRSAAPALSHSPWITAFHRYSDGTLGLAVGLLVGGSVFAALILLLHQSFDGLAFNAVEGVRDWLIAQEAAVLALLLGGISGLAVRTTMKALRLSRNSQEMLQMQSILDGSVLGYILLSQTGQMVWCNQTMSNLIQIEKSNLMLMNISQWKASERITSLVEQVWQGAPDQKLNYTGVTAFGTAVDLRLSLSLVSVGEDAYCLVQAEDMSERHAQEASLVASEAALRETNQRLNTIFDNALGGLVIFEGRQIVWINKGGADILGRLPQDLVGKSTRIFFATDEAWQAVGKETWAAHSQGLPYDGEFEICCQDGTARWIRMSMRMVDKDRSPQAVAVFFDITDHVARQNELKEQRERLACIMNAVNEGIHVLDTKFNVIEHNPAFAAQLGQEGADLTGLSLSKFRVEGASTYPVFKQPCVFEDSYRRADGTIAHVEVHTAPSRLNGQRVVVATSIDIAARKQLDQAKNRFLSNMSHEMRTPLNAIMGFATLLQGADLPADNQSQVEKMRMAGEHLLGIINDVLDLSKLESGEFQLVQEPIQLDLLLNNVHYMLKGMAELKGLALTAHPLPEGLPNHWLGDGQRLRQILLNLVNNGLKFTSTGSVSIAVRAVDLAVGELCFEVQDTGPGISKDQQKHLFQRFSQLDDSATRFHQGTGLGLAIVKELAQRMHGRVELQSEIGQGSKFSVYVRLQPASAQQPPEQPLAKAANATQLPEHLKGLRVLVVDDVALNREVLSALLKKAGVAVEEQVDGQAALTWLKAHPIGVDLVFMDVHMPVMDGLTATSLIRQVHSLAELPILAVSAGATQSDKDAALSVGMQDYLLKPIDWPKVRSALVRWLPVQSGANTMPQWAPLRCVDMDVARQNLGDDWAEFLRQFRGMHAQAVEWLEHPPELTSDADRQAWAEPLRLIRDSAQVLGAVTVSRAAKVTEEMLLAENVPLQRCNRALEAVANHLSQLFIQPRAHTLLRKG